MEISFYEPVAFIRGSSSFKSDFDVACWYVKAVFCPLIFACICKTWIFTCICIFTYSLFLYCVKSWQAKSICWCSSPGRSISFQSWRLKWWLVAHWQPPNGSHPHKLQQYKSILFIKSNTKYWLENIGNLQIVPIHTNFNITKVSSLLSQKQNIYFKQYLQMVPIHTNSSSTKVQKYYQYQVKTLMWTIMATSTLTQK